MSVDMCTKVLLALIAISLVVIAWKMPMSQTSYAQSAVCGGTGFNPCYVSTAGEDYLNVRVVNPNPNKK